MKYFGIKGYKIILLCPKKLEEKFKPANFDLITWFVVTDKK